MRKEDFIRNELSKVPGVLLSEKQAKILCPFHDDTNPSLDIALMEIPGKVASGGYNCFSCGAHGGWNKLAARLKLKPWGKDLPPSEAENEFLDLAKSLDVWKGVLDTSTQEYVKPPTEPWTGAWRGLSEEFLISQGVEAYWDKIAEEYRLYLPVFDINKKLTGHILARGENSEIPNKFKYLNSEGFTSRATWFCLDKEVGSKVLVIVEGPYDALKLRSLGIPAVACLGTRTFTSEKANLLLAVGCMTVVLGLDADEAGRTAAVDFNQVLNELGFTVYDWGLSQYGTDDQKIDPGSAPQQAIDDLQNFLKRIQ